MDLHNNQTFHLPTKTQFLSYTLPSQYNDSIVYIIDENYEKGSSIFEVSGQNVKTLTHPDVLGAVHILETQEYLYIPGFGSNNIWIVDRIKWSTDRVVITGARPHGIYQCQGDIFHVPCRDDDTIRRYQNTDLSIELDPIVLVSGSGPRHLDCHDAYYIITEFSCEIIRAHPNGTMDNIKIIHERSGQGMTGAEIVHRGDVLYVTLRIKDQDGYFLRYDDSSLQETGRIRVGRTPRFFFIMDDIICVLNQDDQSMMLIDPDKWKIMTIISDLPLFPQCGFFMRR